MIDFMRLAYKEALKARDKDEVPVGAVIVFNNKVIAKAYNLRNKKQQSIAHAEILAIQKACKKIGSWRLEDCDLYVTLEPCPMCAGAIIQSRIKNVYFGAYDQKGGSFGSVTDLSKVKGYNHYPNIFGGIMEEESSKLLKDFFKNKRKGSKI
ncbi:MAG: tRNA adenosine(34) deaminase TadA [Anaerorhabdus sp.]